MLPLRSRESISMLGERASVLLLGSRQRLSLRETPLASLPRPQVRRACDRSPAPWPCWSGVPSKLEPSGDDCSVVPTAGGIRPRSIRVAWLYAELVSFPGSRNRDKSHSPGGGNGAPTQREREPPPVRAAVQPDR